MKLLASLLVLGIVCLPWLGFGGAERTGARAPGPRTVAIPEGQIAWRPLGNFSRGGKRATPAAAAVTVAGFEIMQHQVSRADYAACVADGACAAVPAMGADDAPQTHLNWYDATAYAAWLSDETGTGWRLPTDVEWQRAAAEVFGETSPQGAGGDPGAWMLEQYEAGVLLRGQGDPERGARGVNSLGLHGMSDLVWEWTAGCMQTGKLGAGDVVRQAEPYCGARIVGGQHQAIIIDFVRDASVGGCAVGLPPDYLGLRLVRD